MIEKSGQDMEGSQPKRTDATPGRREFVRSASGLVLALAFGTSCKAVETVPKGTLRANVQGLGSTPPSGGSATIVGSRGSRQVVDVPLVGSVEIPLDVGEYVVTYSPPPFFSVAAGQAAGVPVEVTSAGVTTVTFDVTSVLGTIEVAISGLTAAASGGGSASVRNTANPDQPTLALPLDASGSGSLSVAAGDYVVSYTPPSGFAVLGGQPNSLNVSVAPGAVQSVDFTVGVVLPAASVAFHSDFGTARGKTANAIRDTSKPLPWTQLSGSNTQCEVISSDGLNFPSSNVLAIVTQWNGSGSSSFIPRVANSLPVPLVGGSLFYRWYIRLAVPDSVPTWGTPHPIQDGFDAARANWEFGVRRTGAGLWRPRFNCTGNVWPNASWILGADLPTNVTYRFEMQLQRATETTFNVHARVFDSANTLLYDDDDFQNSNGSVRLADNPSMAFKNVADLAGLNCGTNGAFQGTVSTNHPSPFCFQGCFAVRTDEWCGPYADGV